MSEVSFCKDNNITSMTDSEINAIYGTTTQPGLLPLTPYSSENRENNGRLTQKTLTELMDQYKKNNIINTITKEGVKSEYCFYDSRYKYSLKKLIESIQTNENNKNDQIIKAYLSNVQKLNQKLSDLTQIVSLVATVINDSTKDVNKELIKLSEEIKDRESKLDNQNKILSSTTSTDLLYKKMLKYTEEKGRYNNNLLTLYSFLNVVALGLLIYVYKSAD